MRELLGVVEPNAALKEGIGVLSSKFPNAYARVMAEMEQKNPFTRVITEDEKKQQGSHGEGEA